MDVIGDPSLRIHIYMTVCWKHISFPLVLFYVPDVPESLLLTRQLCPVFAIAPDRERGGRERETVGERGEREREI